MAETNNTPSARNMGTSSGAISESLDTPTQQGGAKEAFFVKHILLNRFCFEKNGSKEFKTYII